MTKFLAAGAFLAVLAASVSDWAQTVGVVIAALLSLCGVIVTIRNARQMARDKRISDEKANKTAVDAAAYERARESYEASIANYERDMGNLTTRIKTTEARAVRAESRAESAEQEALWCHRRLGQFERILLLHNIEIPPEEPR